MLLLPEYMVDHFDLRVQKSMSIIHITPRAFPWSAKFEEQLSSMSPFLMPNGVDLQGKAAIVTGGGSGTSRCSTDSSAIHSGDGEERCQPTCNLGIDPALTKTPFAAGCNVRMADIHPQSTNGFWNDLDPSSSCSDKYTVFSVNIERTI